MLNKSSQTARRLPALKTLVFTGMALLGLSVNGQAAEADPVKGGQLAQTCLGCHGAPGLRNPGPVYKIPKIGGQHPEYIVAALKAYKDESRPHPTMRAQAASLSDQDMIDIAAFFGAMNSNSQPNLESAALVAEGEKKAAVCATCHGKTGDGPSTAFPKLAGQYSSYLIHSLKEYRSSERQNAIMNGQASGLSISDIEALSAYFSAQEGGLSAPQSKIFK